MDLVIDRGNHRTSWKIERYASEADAFAGKCYSRWHAAKLFGGAGQTSQWSGNPLRALWDGLQIVFFLVLFGRMTEAGQSLRVTARALRYDFAHFRRGNVLLNAGITVALNLIGGIAATAYNNANAYIGVGDSSTAAAAAQTGLQAATNKTYKAQQATYPQVAAQTITFQSAFGGSDANYAWAEFIVANGSGGTVALNRAVSAQGTKTSGQSWTVSLAITIS